jgi:hypothetical protein
MDLTLFKSFSSGWSTIGSHVIYVHQSILLLHNLFSMFHTFQQKTPSSTSEPEIRVPTSNAWTKCESFTINSKCLTDASIMVHLLMTHQACQCKEKGTHLIMRLHHDHGTKLTLRNNCLLRSQDQFGKTKSRPYSLSHKKMDQPLQKARKIYIIP